MPPIEEVLLFFDSFFGDFGPFALLFCVFCIGYVFLNFLELWGSLFGGLIQRLFDWRY